MRLPRTIAAPGPRGLRRVELFLRHDPGASTRRRLQSGATLGRAAAAAAHQALAAALLPPTRRRLPAALGLAALLLACTATPATAQPWGVWLPGPGAFGDWHWLPPVALAADLDPTDPDGAARLVLTGPEAGLHCRRAGAWQPCASAAGELTRMVTVDSGGAGDFTTIKAACDFVATQTRSNGAQFVVRVGPGFYEEPAFTVPTFTTVQGTGRAPATDTHFVTEPVVIFRTGGSGTYITLFGALADLTVYQAGTLTGPATIINSATNGAALNNITIMNTSSSATHALTYLRSSSGTVIVSNSVLHHVGNINGSQTTMVRLTGSANCSIRYSWLMDTGSTVWRAVRNEGSGHAVLFFNRIGMYTGSNFTIDLDNAGAGTFYVLATPYATSSGTIQHPWNWRDEDVTDALTISASGNVDGGSITSGTVGTPRLGSGTADSTTFLRGDQSWTVPPDADTFAGYTPSGSDFEVVTGTPGATDDCAKWNVDGDLVSAGAACGSGGGAMPAREFYWQASGLLPAEPGDAIPPLALAAGSAFDAMVRLFDDSIDECVSQQLKVPSDLDAAGTLTFRVVWDSAEATSGSAVWDFRHVARAEGEAWDSALTTESAASDTTQGTAGLITVTTWTETVSNAGWAAGDEVYFLVCRDGNGTAGTDDLVGDARLHSLAVLIPRAE